MTTSTSVDPSPCPRPAVLAALVVASALALVAAMSVSVPFLSNDGPTHIYGAYVHNHIHDEADKFARFVMLHTPPTAHGPDVVFRLLEPMLGLRLALHWTNVFAAELFAFAFLTLVTCLEPKRFLVGLLGFPCALQTALYLGTLPFVFGTAFALFALATWLRGGKACGVLTAALLLLAAVCHPFPVAAIGVHLGLVTLASNERRRWPGRLFALLLASLPALVVVVVGSRSEVGGVSETHFDGLLHRTLLIGRNFQPGGSWRPLFALALALAGGASAVWGFRRGQTPRREAALVAGALAFLAAGIALPDDVSGWQLANIRPLPFAFMPLMACIPVERMGARARTLATGAGILYASSSFTWAACTGVAVDRATKGALAGLGHVSAEPRDWLPVIVDATGRSERWDIPRFEPLLHVADLYAIELGGVTLFTQADAPWKHDVLRTHPDPGETPPSQFFALAVSAAKTPAERHDAMRIVAAIASTHDGVILWGSPADARDLAGAGFTASYADGGLFVGHFEGCSGRVHLEGVHGPVTAEVGFWPRRTPAVTLHAVPDADGVVDAPLAKTGCGPMWLHVVGRACAGAAGPVRAEFARRGDNVIACRLE